MAQNHPSPCSGEPARHMRAKPSRHPPYSWLWPTCHQRRVVVLTFKFYQSVLLVAAGGVPLACLSCGFGAGSSLSYFSGHFVLTGKLRGRLSIRFSQALPQFLHPIDVFFKHLPSRRRRRLPEQPHHTTRTSSADQVRYSKLSASSCCRHNTLNKPHLLPGPCSAQCPPWLHAGVRWGGRSFSCGFSKTQLESRMGTRLSAVAAFGAVCHASWLRGRVPVLELDHSQLDISTNRGSAAEYTKRFKDLLVKLTSTITTPSVAVVGGGECSGPRIRASSAFGQP